MSASSHLVEEGGGPTVNEPNAAVASNDAAANGAAGQVDGNHVERPGPAAGGIAGTIKTVSRVLLFSPWGPDS